MLYNHFDSLCNIGIVQFSGAGNLTLRFFGFQGRIVLNGFVYLIECFVGDVVLQNIQNEAFFNRLLHGIGVERLAVAILIDAPEQL